MTSGIFHGHRLGFQTSLFLLNKQIIGCFGRSANSHSDGEALRRSRLPAPFATATGEAFAPVLAVTRAWQLKGSLGHRIPSAEPRRGAPQVARRSSVAT